MASTRWLSDSAWPSRKPARLPRVPGTQGRAGLLQEHSKERTGQGRLRLPGSKPARCPHAPVSPGARLPGRGRAAPHPPAGPRRHSPDRKWSEALDWARSALFRSLSSSLGALPGQARPGALLRPLTASEGLMPSDKPRRSAALRQRGRAWPWPSPRRTAVRSQWTPRPAPGTSEETQEGGKPHSSNQQAIFSSGQS